MMNIRFLILAAFIFITACDTRPMTQFEIKTAEGGLIKMVCPIVDPLENRLTYFIDHECRVIEHQQR